MDRPRRPRFALDRALVRALAPVALAPWSQAQNAAEPPRVVPTRVEKVAGGVSATTIHGWNTGRLVRRGGELVASAALSNPQASHYWDHGGASFRRGDGGWKEVGRLALNPYTMAVGPDGTWWVVAPASYTECRILRSLAPDDLSRFEEVHRGSCSYLGAAIGPEGNSIVLYAESADSTAGVPNGVTVAFASARPAAGTAAGSRRRKGATATRGSSCAAGRRSPS